MNLDKQDMKVLSSDTRVEILRALSHRRKMPSELARELGIRPSTVVEHLKILKKSGMVIVINTGHKWKYYDLTSKGSNLIKPKFPVQFAILLSIGIIVMFTGFTNIYTMIDYDFDYPIVTITEQISGSEVAKNTITDSEAVSTGIASETTDDLGQSPTLNDSKNEIFRITNTTYKREIIQIPEINWTSLILIVFGAVVIVLSAQKIDKIKRQ